MGLFGGEEGGFKNESVNRACLGIQACASGRTSSVSSRACLCSAQRMLLSYDSPLRV